MVWANIKKELTKAVGRAGITQEMNATDIVEIARTLMPEVFPRDIVSEIDVIYFKDATLAICVSSSVIAQEVKLREKIFTDRLNKYFDKDIIKHLRIMT